MLDTAETISAAEVAAGNVIIDDIACLVVSARNNGGEVTLFVEDGNGFFYHIRLQADARIRRLNWSDEDWKNFRQL